MVVEIGIGPLLVLKGVCIYLRVLLYYNLLIVQKFLFSPSGVYLLKGNVMVSHVIRWIFEVEILSLDSKQASKTSPMETYWVIMK